MTAHGLRTCVDQTLDAIVLNLDQALQLYNPDPEANSLAERLVALRNYGVPEKAIKELLADVRVLLDLNARECGIERGLAGHLEELARVAHGFERDSHIVGEALTIKSAARALRPALQTIASDSGDGITYVSATRTIDRVIERSTSTALRSESMRKQLGKAPHDLLCRLVDERECMTAGSLTHEEQTA